MRIGTTSYIYPDNIIPNAKKLCGLVDDIQLILFEGKEYSNLPTSEDIDVLSDISEQSGLTYTVHLPIDTDICSKDEEFRIFSVKSSYIEQFTEPKIFFHTLADFFHNGNHFRAKNSRFFLILS